MHTLSKCTLMRNSDMFPRGVHLEGVDCNCDWIFFVKYQKIKAIKESIIDNSFEKDTFHFLNAFLIFMDKLYSENEYITWKVEIYK